LNDTGGSVPLPSSGVLVGGSGVSVGVTVGVKVAVGVRVGVRVGLSVFVGEGVRVREGVIDGVSDGPDVAASVVASSVASVVAPLAGAPPVGFSVRSAAGVPSGTLLGMGTPVTRTAVGSGSAVNGVGALVGGVPGSADGVTRVVTAGATDG
jgi:hypothetical protein